MKPNPYLLIDVRSEEEFDDGHLDSSINIEYFHITHEIGNYAKSKSDKILVYCRHGRRSGIAKIMLEQKGYTNVINIGSYSKLKDKILDDF